MTVKRNIEMHAVVGVDPIVKNLPKGFMLVILKVATHELIHTVDCQSVSVTVWHSLRLWNEMALFVSMHIKKGDRIKIEGVLTYQCDQFNQRTPAVIKATSITQIKNS